MSQRQPDPMDDRVTCRACWFLVADRRCRNWQAARLTGGEVGGIKTLPQRCPAFAPLPTAQAPPPAPAVAIQDRDTTDRDRAQDRTAQPIN